MTELSQKFAKAIATKGLKNADISKKYNISRQLVNNFFTIQKTLTEKMKDVCDGENINLHWLLTGKGEMFINNECNMPTITNTFPSNDVIAINFYPEVYAAAGYGAVNGDQAPKQLHISKIFLDEIINVRKYDKLDIIRVYGDSMEPYVSNGEYVIIEKNPDAKNGETIIASINGEVYIKRFKADPFKKWIKLTSDNTTYDDIHIEGDNLQLISIIGIVRAKIKPF